MFQRLVNYRAGTLGMVMAFALLMISITEQAEAVKPAPQDPHATEQQLTDHDTHIQTLLIELLSRQQSWDKKLSGAERFALVMGGVAVLDKETGLVWQAFLPTTPDPRTWVEAIDDCNRLGVGDRRGWRLPSIQELSSLVDLNESSPAISTDLFGNVQSSYWSATSDANNTIVAYRVIFDDGVVDNGNKAGPQPVWCVRGGQNHGDAH